MSALMEEIIAIERPCNRMSKQLAVSRDKQSEEKLERKENKQNQREKGEELGE
jgi:hypothetical protein